MSGLQTSEMSSVYRGAPEDILVVPRAQLAVHQLLPNGFSADAGAVERMEQVVREHAAFYPRERMEVDEAYKQIIPYCVFAYGDQLFLMQRSAKANETRLASKYTLGIGGHVRQKDLEGSILEWGVREFHEEVVYDGRLSFEPIGILNDDSDAVGRVHIGVVYLLRGESSDIAIRSELQSGLLATIDECRAVYDRLEGWSQKVFDAVSRQGLCMKVKS